MQVRLERKVLMFFFGACYSFGMISSQASIKKSSLLYHDPLLGPRVGLKSEWVGHRPLSRSTHFLIMAGHADSQGIAGAGTAGEAVALKGKSPMDPSISDELFWNLLLRDAIVQAGRDKGLHITGYEPGIRNLDDGNHPNTNWSVGAQHVKNGGYALEIHFDSYGEYGFGSGLIPAISTKLNLVDESLAYYFGRYPLFFRGGLGAPKRGIRILEIGKLEGNLEDNLRNANSREKVLKSISNRIIDAIILGTQSSNIENINPQLNKDDIAHPVSHH